MKILGRHVIADFYDCTNYKPLNNSELLEKILIDAAEIAGAKVIKSILHNFSPFGVSGIVIIAESHISIHTWPEYKFASIDIYTCGTVIDPWKSYEYIFKKLKPRNVTATELKRGILTAIPEESLYSKIQLNGKTQKPLV